MQPTLIPAKNVRKDLGNISNMTLHRWLADKDLAFPRPLYIKTRRYFQAEEIEAFKQRMTMQGLSQLSGRLAAKAGGKVA